MTHSSHQWWIGSHTAHSYSACCCLFSTFSLQILDPKDCQPDCESLQLKWHYWGWARWQLWGCPGWSFLMRQRWVFPICAFSTVTLYWLLDTISMLKLEMLNISYCVQDLTNIMSGRGTCTCKSVRMNESKTSYLIFCGSLQPEASWFIVEAIHQFYS